MMGLKDHMKQLAFIVTLATGIGCAASAGLAAEEGTELALLTPAGTMSDATPPPETLALVDPDHSVVAIVDLSDQVMRVYLNGALHDVWPVSTGLGGHATPTGAWNAYWLSPNHRSSLYNNAPMPWAVFFNGNYAVHGTNAVELLGQPASHGCVRLHTDNAAAFFALVEAHGLNDSLVTIVD